MTRRHSAASAALTAALLSPFLAACGSGDSTTTSASKQGARKAVESYVTALNTRDANRLIEVGGVPNDARARNEARRILADKGGRELSVKKIQIDLDMGPDTGSAKLTAQEKSGRNTHDTFSVLKKNGTWHLTLFTDRPPPPGKPTSEAE
ncbi:hypothetical protein OG302_28780 [Streptomyces sp. NBC_01283]|uniref:hypothetical protein n=1 Tax=Streptomyces sp. NBC_01283 TaxID=2903812 RepID=UPI00352E0635|nr:hypothetical protein OG302_28780 [Streptomyces sp. NBC_01283]